MPRDTAGAPAPVKSAARTLEVLEHLSQVGGRRSLAVLHTELGIPKSSLHGILRTLRARGWVEVDASGTLFGLGLRALLVGTAYIDADEVVSVVAPALDDLSRQTGETVHLARLDGPEVVYLATRSSTHSLRTFSRVGRRLPAHATSLGKALLAARDDREVADLLPDDLAALTGRTITEHAALRRELGAVRLAGHAVDREENTIGIACVGMAVPLADPPRDALSLSVPVARLDDARERELVELLAHAITTVAPRAGR